MVHKTTMVLFGVILIATFVNARPEGKIYPVRLQPELDSVNAEEYFMNERLLNLQIKCILHDGPCDVVGRWIKPRISAYFKGECPLCTPIQKKNVEKLVVFITEKRPDLYKQAVEKFGKSTDSEEADSTSTTETSSPAA